MLKAVLSLVLVVLFIGCASARSQVTKSFRSSSLTVKPVIELPAVVGDCLPEVCAWWNDLRTAADVLQRKRDEKTRKRFASLLSAGMERRYRVPIADNPARTLDSSRPVGPRDLGPKLSGNIQATIEYLADGKVGKVTLVKGIAGPIDNAFKDSARKTIFLPEVRDGQFVSSTVPVSIVFTDK